MLRFRMIATANLQKVFKNNDPTRWKKVVPTQKVLKLNGIMASGSRNSLNLALYLTKDKKDFRVKASSTFAAMGSMERGVRGVYDEIKSELDDEWNRIQQNKRRREEAIAAANKRPRVEDAAPAVAEQASVSSAAAVASPQPMRVDDGESVAQANEDAEQDGDESEVAPSDPAGDDVNV